MAEDSFLKSLMVQNLQVNNDTYGRRFFSEIIDGLKAAGKQ